MAQAELLLPVETHDNEAENDGAVEVSEMKVEEEEQEDEDGGLDPDAIRAAFSTHMPVPAQPLKEGWAIPVIDLSLLQHAPTRPAAVEQIAKACQDWGFFHVINHGVPDKVINDMWKAFDALFQAPPEERAKFDNGPFLPPDIMKKLSKKLQSMPKFGESRDTIRFSKLNPDDGCAIPDAPLEFREPAFAFFRALRDVGFELLEAISESLGLEREYIRKVTGNNPCINSSIHRYIPYHNGENTLGLNAHRDIDTLTLLVQNDVVGLQVLKEDRWVDVNVLPGSLIVNVGEVIQAITNQKYHSVMHRALLDKEKARSSITCFLIPTSESMIEPLSHLVSDKNPPWKPPCDWETFFYNYFATSLKL